MFRCGLKTAQKSGDPPEGLPTCKTVCR